MKMIPESAARRAMKVLEVILKAMAREIKWIQAADILGVTPRTIRRMRAAYQERVIGRYDSQGHNPGGQPPDPRGLSLWGPEKRSKMGKGKLSASPSSPDVPTALGSLPSVALSSGETYLG